MISTHTHVETFFTASTLDAFVKKASELGRSVFTYTDIGSFYSVLLAHKAAQKAKLGFAPGVELYIKDPSTPFNKALPEASYFTVTVYAQDQEAFQALIKMASQKRNHYINLNEDRIPLYLWSDIEALKPFNVNFVLGGHHSLLAKPSLAGKGSSHLEPTIEALQRLEKPIHLALIAGKEDKAYSEQVKIMVFNPVKEQRGEVFLSLRDKVEVMSFKAGEKARMITISAAELANGRHNKIVAFTKNGVKFKSNVEIISAQIIGRFSALSRDFVKDANRFHLSISQKYNIPLISSDYAFMADKLDKPVQDVKLVELRKEYAQYMMSEEEYTQDLSNQGIPLDKIQSAVQNSKNWAMLFNGFNLKYGIRVPAVEGDLTSAKKLMAKIKEMGRMRWGDSAYEERLKREIKVLAQNPVQDLLPYFFPIMDMQEREMASGVLIGPGRGSAAGSLINYLIGVTHVDPMKYDLSFERFLNEDRVLAGDFPDVDSDRGDRMVLTGGDAHDGLLYQSYGKKAAQISTRSMMRLKSSILDVNRYLKGEVEKEIENISKNLPAAPQGVSDSEFVLGYEDNDGNYHPGLIEYNETLQAYIKTRPEEWAIVERCLGITRAYGKHASAFLIADKNIEDFIPLMPGDVYTQYEAKGASAAGGIKYDFLVVANLLDIQKCMALINKKTDADLPTGYFMHNGEKLFIWDLPQDPDAFKSVWNGNTSGLFQIDTPSMVPFVRDIKPASISDISDILALVRPGTLDAKDEKTGRTMAREYVERRFGRSVSHIPELQALLPETHGIILYQEGSSKVARELAGMNPVEAEKLRRALGKKLKTEVDKFKGQFLEGAEKKVSPEVARQIWDQIESGSRYSFNKSHSTSYGIITYATMFLRHHYPLEFWTAVLSNADKKEIKEKYYKHVRHLLAAPDINLSTDDMIIDYTSRKIRSKLTVIKGLSGAGMANLLAKRPFSSLADLIQKEAVKPAMARKLIAVGVMDSLFAPNTSLIDKLQQFEDQVEIKKYNDKIAAGKKAKPVSQGKIDPFYLSLSPLEEFKLKKEILPTMELSVTDILTDVSSKIKKGPSGRFLFEGGKRDLAFVNGELAERINTSEVTNKYGVEYAVGAHVISKKEFSYSGGTKRALKLIVDTDGYNRECVLWPDYETGRLVYPNFEEGDIVVLSMKKKNERDASVQKIHIDFI